MDPSVKDQPVAAGSRLGRESAAAGLGSFVALGVGLLLELTLAFLLGPTPRRTHCSLPSAFRWESPSSSLPQRYKCWSR